MELKVARSVASPRAKRKSKLLQTFGFGSRSNPQIQVPRDVKPTRPGRLATHLIHQAVPLYDALCSSTAGGLEVEVVGLEAAGSEGRVAFLELDAAEYERALRSAKLGDGIQKLAELSLQILVRRPRGRPCERPVQRLDGGRHARHGRFPDFPQSSIFVCLLCALARPGGHGSVDVVVRHLSVAQAVGVEVVAGHVDGRLEEPPPQQVLIPRVSVLQLEDEKVVRFLNGPQVLGGRVRQAFLRVGLHEVSSLVGHGQPPVGAILWVASHDEVVEEPHAQRRADRAPEVDVVHAHGGPDLLGAHELHGGAAPLKLHFVAVLLVH
eukprot:scaffold8342_cov248-Pinguiococcus_pyrenoidosus.AAC.1